MVYEETLGVTDFFPSGDMVVVYITEGDLVAGTLYKKKLVKLRKVHKLSVVFLGSFS